MDAQGEVKNKIVYPGNYVRLLRQTAQGTYLMVCDTMIREGNSAGQYIWEAPIEKFSHAWKAVRLPNGHTFASAGYGAFLIELDAAGKIVRKFGAKGETPEAVNTNFYATFQLLPNGDVVVALLDNAFATLKRFYREPNRIRLQPANSSMDPIYVRDISIQGVVRAVIRQFARA